MLRIEDHTGFSNLDMACIKNRVTDWKIDQGPTRRYGEADWQHEESGCEDRRITHMAEDRCWYITYTAYSPKGAAVRLARSCDLVKAERIGLILSLNNKDAVLFPQKFDSQWAVLHRTDASDHMQMLSAEGNIVTREPCQFKNIGFRTIVSPLKPYRNSQYRPRTGANPLYRPRDQLPLSWLVVTEPADTAECHQRTMYHWHHCRQSQ